MLLLVVVFAAIWRFRSWLVGVFENVEVMGHSGADLEAELLHHETNHQAADEQPPPEDEDGR